MASTITVAATVSDIVLPTHSDEKPIFGDADPAATARRYRDIGVAEVVVKNGAEAALAVTADGQWSVAPKGGAKVVDPTAAGDSFNGAYLSARLAGAAPDAALAAAHRVAGIVIGHPGALIDPALVRA
jgi:2-dehydro-3-deoxygluconokinase